MNYLCISDFSKTLIKNDGTISKYSIDIINEFIKENKFIIISEADIYELLEFKNKYNLNIDIASVLDGIIYIDNKQIKFELDSNIINDIINNFKDDIYTAFTNDIIFNYHDRLSNLYPKTYEISDKFNSSTYINIVINVLKEDEFTNYLKKCNLFYKLIGKDKNRAFYNVKKAFNNKIDVFNYIKNYYKDYKTIGISDSYTDLLLLNMCDIKIAMKNSDKKLLENIELKTRETNEKDGVAIMLNDICHLK